MVLSHQQVEAVVFSEEHSRIPREHKQVDSSHPRRVFLVVRHNLLPALEEPVHLQMAACLVLLLPQLQVLGSLVQINQLHPPVYSVAVNLKQQVEAVSLEEQAVSHQQQAEDFSEAVAKIKKKPGACLVNPPSNHLEASLVSKHNHRRNQLHRVALVPLCRNSNINNNLNKCKEVDSSSSTLESKVFGPKNLWSDLASAKLVDK